MDAENHPDPFQDAMNHALQRAIQITYAVVTGTQIYIHHQTTQARAVAERDRRIRRALDAQIRADRDAARAGWAPALDPDWLREADLLHTSRAWGAAMPYADRTVPWYEPTAATAMRKCEERLRDLHPYAMARYDRLRGDGMAPAEAMRQAAPLFTRPARARDGSSIRWPAVDAATGMGFASASPGDHVDGVEDLAETQERRGRRILEGLQARARAEGRDPLGEAEQRTALEIVTNLPDEIIDRVVQPDAAATGLVHPEQNRAAAAERARAADLDAATDLTATPAVDERTQNLVGAHDAAATADAAGARGARVSRPWERDFPTPIRDVMAATAAQPSVPASPAAAHTTVPKPVRGQRP